MEIRRDAGSALVVALLMMVLLSALGIGLALLADTERLAASSYARTIETLYAADAVAWRAASDLRAVPDWSVLLNGALASGFADTTRTPLLPSGATLNLDAVTTDVQAQSDALGPAGANRPIWRLYAWGPVAGLLAVGVIDSAQYGAVWVADDRFDTDGAPLADANGVVAIHAEAYGWAGARRIIEAVLGRVPVGCPPGGAYLIASLRPTGTIRASRVRIPILDGLQNCASSDQPASPRLISWREVR